MRRVLIANIFGIGDVLFTTPLIATLRREFEGVEIDYLSNARTKDIVRDIPGVGGNFIYEKDDFSDLWRSSKAGFFKAVSRLFTGVRKKKYDAVFDFTLSREFGLFFALCGIRRRIGLDYKGRGMFLTDKIPLEGFEGRHVAEHYLDLLAPLGVFSPVKEMRIIPDEKSSAEAGEYLKEKGGPSPLVAVIPGGGASWGGHASRKRWQAEGFARTADILAENAFAVAVMGDTSEQALCQSVAEKMKNDPVFVENNLDLGTYAALLARCELVLCNDGGPLHMAVALGVRTVSIFGPVDEAVYGPYPPSDRHRVITAQELECRPCYGRFKLPECDKDNKCLADIRAEKVAEACMNSAITA